MTQKRKYETDAQENIILRRKGKILKGADAPSRNYRFKGVQINLILNFKGTETPSRECGGKGVQI